MTYRNRNILRITIFLTALLAGGSITAMAQGSGTSTGVVVRGNVYGGGNQAAVKINSEVNISTGQVEGNVYGGGNLGDVGTHVDQATPSVGNYDWKDQDGNIIDENTATNKMTGVSQVNISGGTIGRTGENATTDEDHGNVFGGGKGAATTFECEQGMVYRTNVSITTTGTVVKGNVYGGGKVSRAEENTVVTIGTANGSDVPIIEGSVFAAGAGIETHGYSALVRGASTVTVQGSAQVWKNVYGGGQLASVGRYKVKTPANEEDDDVPATLPYGMPAHLVNGGTSTVVIQNSAVIGTDNVATTGHVYGAGQGLEPRQDYDYHTQAQYNAIEGNNPDNYNIDEHQPKRMNKVNGVDTWQYFETKAAYLQFVETLALSAGTNVTITGGATIKGSVFGGSESGFVYHDTDLKIQGGTINGDAFGGGRGLESFAEAGRVRGNTELTISSGAAVHGNVYGGGNLGDVGTINKSDANYNYVWKNSDANGNNLATADFNNIAGYNVPSSSTHDTNKNTGICTVTINGGTIGTGVQMSDDGTFANGNVFGAGRGSTKTWWCEKAIAYATSVTINAGIVNGSVYGGGEVGRVEDDAKVVIGVANATGNAAPTITGSVFGAGAGKKTHGYSALVRGNAAVTVQGVAQVGESVYGGGEIASVGKFNVVGGLPTTPLTGGYCTVEVKGNAKVGASGTGHNVFGACKGVTPAYNNTQNNPNRSKSMQLVAYKPDGAAGTTWDEYEDEDGNKDARFIWRYYASEDDYLAFLKTLALTSHPTVTIGGSASVYGSVYGGGQRGVTLGNVDVNITGGTIEEDVYGGGALADTNLGNWDVNNYVEATALNEGESITDLYTRTGTVGNYKYTKVTDSNATFSSGTYYRLVPIWAHTEGSAYYTTSVDLTGGLIKGDAYGGGLGQKTGFDSASEDIEATVWGDIAVTLNGTAFDIYYYEDEGYTDVVKSGRVFGCNNLLGSPKGNVTVTVWKTVEGNTPRTNDSFEKTVEGVTQVVDLRKSEEPSDHSYELAAVYGGGNLASYTATGKKTHVIIHGCDDTSIETVYGGGNAAAVPETDVDVYSAYEIGALFGGGNGNDKYRSDAGWQENPGADVNGNTDTMIYGGTVHEAYGASNNKGTIYGNVTIDVGENAQGETCPLDVGKLVGAGKNADVNGDLILVMGCKPAERIPLVYGGADNANVNGDVELTITSGNFGKVFGGNNENGVIMGHIKLNIEETGDCSTPITIEQLYLGGNFAAYSQYGYYKDGTDDATGKPILKPRTAEMAAITDSETEGYTPAVTTAEYGTEIRKTAPYAAPELNIISCTYIGEVFGGGLGETAVVYGNPIVNINMIPGAFANNETNGVPAKMTELELSSSDNPNNLGIIGDVFGGGDAAKIEGNTTVNIGTETTVNLVSTSETKNVMGAYITGSVYGGGNEADVTGNTFVNICAKKTGDTYTSVAFTPTDAPGVKITGNVFGGGKGVADNFKCEKAMVGIDGDGIEHPDGGTTINIGNGTVNGSVYGGGEKGRVEKNAVVNIGFGDGKASGTPTSGDGEASGTPTSAPVIMGNVFGAGAGVSTHGYAALLRGNTWVTVAGNAKVEHSVYGGGEIASVGRYTVAQTQDEATANGVDIGEPYSLVSTNSGNCHVTVGGYAEIGPDDMQMKAAGGPDDTGYVFGAGKGVLPYEGYDDYDYDGTNDNAEKAPWRKTPGADMASNDDDVTETYTADKEDNYIKYIGTLALATTTEVTIGDHAFIKGSVYGGSENGRVQHNTDVKIQDYCQIGNGWDPTKNNGAGGGVNARYNEADFINPSTATPAEIEAKAAILHECASWDYGVLEDGKMVYHPYDKYEARDGASTTATDGHTFYGNVFGGGSGLYPYLSRKEDVGYEWIRTAGQVGGNTNVTITGGHILTSVYGGNELTDVGNGLTVEADKGICKVKMSGGTLGVPRTLDQIAAHPVTCYLFGAGKGDQRIHFNQWTNVGSVEVEVSGGIIYGSVFGGGEDGHVLGDVKVTIKDTSTTTGEGEDAVTTTTSPVIGTWGTSYVDGNIFGGGRGFGGDALTAGVVCGNVDVEIQGGTMLGSIYGGGRLGSVGTYLVPTTVTDKYGTFIDDGKQQTINEVTIGNGTVDVSDASGVTHGHVTIEISGGIIGNDLEYKYLTSSVDTSGKTAEAIATERATELSSLITENYIPNTEFEYNSDRGYYMLKHTKGGNVFAGSMGRFYGLDNTTVLPHWVDLGKVKSTKLTITGGTIKSSVYGGGELGWTSGTHETTEGKAVSTEISIEAGTIGSVIEEAVTSSESVTNEPQPRYTFGSVFGGGYGSAIEVLTDADDNNTYPKFQAGRVMYSTKVDMSAGTVLASVYGGGELANVGYGFHSYNQDMGETLLTDASEAANTYVTVSGGTVGKDPANGVYFGGATMGNVYGGGSGNNTIARCGLVLGNTNVSISGDDTRIYHNVYGGGAYGSVGDYEYETGEETVSQNGQFVTSIKVFGIDKLHTAGTGTANVTITGGTIGYDGKDNGMVFGSSRGDVQGEGTRDDYMAWVNDANVTIGTSASGSTPAASPQVYGSVYGSGENGHTLHNTDVQIHGGTIGVDNSSATGYTVTSGGKTYNGAEYPSRGNVYGGGCGTDTYVKDGKKYYNPMAGIVKGNATVKIDGGHVVRSVYGGGSMGSVGTFTNDANGKPISCVEGAAAVPATDTTPEVPAVEGTGLCTVTVSGGKIGPSTMAMPNVYGNVFGAGKGEMHDPTQYPNLETSAYFNNTLVTINGTAFVKGSVYGGSESGHVLSDTHVVIDGDCQIGCGKNTTERHSGDIWETSYVPNDENDLECVSWLYKAPFTPYDKFADEDGNYPSGSAHPDADNAHPEGTDGHTFYGNVFGGGSGYEPYAPGQWLPTAGMVEGNTLVEIKGGHILTSVYGGCEMSDVGAGGVRKMTVIGGNISEETPDMFYDITKPGGKSTVKMSGGTLGVPRTLAQIAAHPVTCYLFGAGKGDQRIFFNKTTNVKEVEVEISGGRIYGSVFGGGEDGHVMRDVKMTIKDNAYIGTWGTSYVEGNVFGGGRGFSGEALTAGNVGGSVNIDIQGGTMLGSIYGGGRLGSVGYGLYLTNETITIDGESDTPYGTMRPDGYDDRGNEVSGFKRGYITINISGGTIGNDIEYKYNPSADDKLKMPTTTFDYQNQLSYTRGGNVFTGCMGRLYALDNTTPLSQWKKLGKCKQTVLNITGGTIKSNVYGGGELGVVEENATVNILGGTIGTKVVDSADETKYYYYGSAFGSGKGSNDNVDDISEAGTIGGNVKVNLNGMDTADYDEDVHGATTGDVAKLEANSAGTGYVLKSTAKGGIVNRIFGCNDMNGTPKGTVKVHVFATQKEGADNISTKADKAANADAGTYDVEAVYGGGNLAAYEPKNALMEYNETNKATLDAAYAEVIIDGCNLTSIGTVYGGGNAASAPATNVTVNGTYEIGRVFGGGNGMDKLPDGTDNPGANVGYYHYPNADNAAYDTKEDRIENYGYGSGKAHATIYGGTVHEVYGGSNTKGNIRVEARTTLEDQGACDFNVGEAYGGGRNAPMDGDAVLEVGCISGLDIAYGGASNADVNGDVILNITNGTYGRVFGGNNLGGAIRGSIMVNIEETGCNPIIIGELYGGGNEAPYSVYGYELDAQGKPQPLTSLPSGGTKQADPVVNVKSFTSIGKIFGGGYGARAKMIGNPEVNINVVKGKYSNREIAEGESVYGFDIPSHESGAIGAIGSVFGGGNAAEVIGTPHVNIGTKVGEVIPLVSRPIEDSEGNTPSPEGWTSYQLVTVEGVDIRGNVYGAGNNAPVTGDTEVVIGKNNDVKTYSFTSYNAQNDGTAWSSGLAQTTGKYVTLSGNSKLAEVEILTNGKYGDFVGQKFYVDPNAATNGDTRTELKNANGASLDPQLFVSIKPFEHKTYSFKSYGAASGGTQYSEGTAAPTGNFKTFNGTEYMQIVVLTNPGEISWEGRTFYVPVNAKTDGTERTQLRKATGDPEAVWVSISE